MYSPHSINRVIARIIALHNELETEKAKAENREPELLPHFSVHNLRHTFCTRFCESETNIKVIQEIMGHADITTAMDIYITRLHLIKRKRDLKTLRVKSSSRKRMTSCKVSKRSFFVNFFVNLIFLWS